MKRKFVVTLDIEYDIADDWSLGVADLKKLTKGRLKIFVKEALDYYIWTDRKGATHSVMATKVRVRTIDVD